MSVRSLAVAAALTGLTVQLSAAAPAEALSLFDQQKYAAFVADAETGEVLYSRRADMQRFPASITKVMTLYMVFEQLAAG